MKKTLKLLGRSQNRYDVRIKVASEMDNVFGERLRQIRREKNVVLTALAITLETTQTTLSKYENGLRIPDIDMLVKIAKYFNVSTDYLVGVSDIKYPHDTKFNDLFLFKLKEEMINQGVDFNEVSPQEIVKTYKLIKEYNK